ncbi:MAG: D-alanyl-D-alanine endopeptidase precursor [Pseudomonadota bacterium]|jgi:D-alanyl-D-alanine endopeptidase (penicillin-binding protein 7)
MVFSDLKGIPVKGLSVCLALLVALSAAPVVQAKAPVAKTETTKTAKKKAVKKPAAKKTHLAKPKVKSKTKLATAKKHKKQRVLAQAPRRMSVGQRLGLHSVSDPLSLSASVALVVDQSTNEVLFSKNDEAVLPIASLTKLMTGLVVADAGLPMDEVITITHDDADTLKGSRSRLVIGASLTRGELMHLALMSSENRAAHALGRTHPGGMDAFVQAMNRKAQFLGMGDSRFVDPTGLSSHNQSSARDLATLAAAAYNQPIMRELSTSPSYLLDMGHKTLQYNNSNGLVRSERWDIGLQKTGYIAEAGRCLVMQATVAGREVIMVFLDSVSKVARLRDAERVRQWMEAQDHVLPMKLRAVPRG